MAHVCSHFCSIDQRRMEQVVGVACFVRGCSGAWLSPPGPRRGNCQWPYSLGLALAGTPSGICRWVGFEPLCSHFVTSRHKAWSCQHRFLISLGTSQAGRKLVALCPACCGAECCARLIPTQTPQKYTQRCGGRKQGLFLYPRLFLQCSFDSGKREPSSCSGICMCVVH